MGTVVNPETKIDLRTIDLFDVGDVAKGEARNRWSRVTAES